jgi:uncharacterized damage-inducible protein DinB
METNSIHQQVNAPVGQIILSEDLLVHWQGHRRLTRRVIDAFPEDKLFSYSIGGMRPFAAMAIEVADIAREGIKGIVSGEWKSIAELDHYSGESVAKTKAGLLQQWDLITEQIDELWLQIPAAHFQDVELAFGAYEGRIIDTLFYFIDNEIHHRAQGYVYLRSLGIEPPAFYER